MFPPQKKSADLPFLNFGLLEGPSAMHTLMIESKKDKDERAVKSLMIFRLEEVDSILEKEGCTICLEQILAKCGESMFYVNAAVLDKKFYDYYKSYIALSRKKNIIDLCCETIEQFKCPK